ncbi:MAG: hypothetical protein CVV59_00890 [Tenericutes bacterium HGW-Tenericutes-4]|nr:MAG: hypothetical protein CVV59_00890 [Tenericutes bacterium HGW-Tenericutes-4]
MKQKLKSYGFWMSLTMAIILVLQTLGKTFSFTVDEEVIVGIVTSVIGVFVVLGFVQKKENNIENENLSESQAEKTKRDEQN